MNRSRKHVALVLLGLAACGSDAPSITPNTDDFNVSDSDQQELDSAAKDGEGAEGTYTYDDSSMVLTITLEKSSFDCGPIEGAITATVESVDASTLVLRFDGEGDTTTFTRVDQDGVGLVGIWKTMDPNLYLVLTSGGAAQIFGEPELCDDERPRNGDNCLLAEASTADIVVDGDLSDWSTVGANATVGDPAGDHQGGDEAADVLATKVAFDGQTVFVLTELAATPGPSFADSYRLEIQGYNGLSLQASIFYSSENEDWELSSTTGGVEARVGDSGIEWSADISGSLGEGFESVDFIMAQPWGAQSLDPVECVYFEL